jgi:hypothetical protein
MSLSSLREKKLKISLPSKRNPTRTPSEFTMIRNITMARMPKIMTLEITSKVDPN